MPLESYPRVSIIIPAFNAARYLPDAIASIRRQHYAPLEVIVVDDGSTDDTEQVVSQWPDVRYIRQENAGVSKARNAGIEAASGDLLAFLDADDLWTPDHLALLLPPLLADVNLRFVWGKSKWVRCVDDAAGLRELEVEHESYPLFFVMTGLYRRVAFAEAGLFDETLRLGEDLAWFAAARQKQISNLQIPQNVCIYRRHLGSLTDGKGAQKHFVLAAMRSAVQRRRAS